MARANNGTKGVLKTGIVYGSLTICSYRLLSLVKNRPIRATLISPRSFLARSGPGSARQAVRSLLALEVTLGDFDLRSEFPFRVNDFRRDADEPLRLLQAVQPGKDFLRFSLHPDADGGGVEVS